MYWFLKQRFLLHPEAGAVATGGAASTGEEETPAQEEVGGETANTPPDGLPAGAEKGGGEAAKGETAPFTKEQEALMESLFDRRAHKLGNRVKELEAKLADKNKKLTDRMTDDEIRQMELDEKEAKLAEREAELAAERLQRLATEAIVAAGLGQDSKNTLRLRAFVMSEGEEGVHKKAGEFKALVDDYAKEQVQQIFKNGGRTPEAGSGAAPAAGYDQKITECLQAGNMGEAAYWTRKKAEEKTGG